MAGLNLEICLVYLDDIIVYSSDVGEHLNRLRAVLDRLRDARWKLKPSKCRLFQKLVSIPGHVISGDGIATDSAKIESVATWPVPACLRDLRSFVGVSRNYRRFVKGFAEIAAPLHKLTGKGISLQWSAACQTAFECLKQALITSPVLAMPIHDDVDVLDTDASDHSIGAVLSQVQAGEERVNAYGSRTCW